MNLWPLCDDGRLGPSDGCGKEASHMVWLVDPKGRQIGPSFTFCDLHGIEWAARWSAMCKTDPQWKGLRVRIEP